MPAGNIQHDSFAVGNVREFADELRRRGADIVWVKEMKHGSNIFIRDNAGNLIEFVQATQPTETAAWLGDCRGEYSIVCAARRLSNR